jgi:hypothetical protein
MIRAEPHPRAAPNAQGSPPMRPGDVPEPAPRTPWKGRRVPEALTSSALRL